MGVEDVRKELARDLDELRRSVGLSFRELARRAGHPVSTVHDALRGQRFPRLDTVLAVVRVCGGEDDEWRRRWIAASAEDEPREPSRPATELTPAQLPADIATFTGRSAELDRIAQWQAAGAALIVATGPAGVGKTALAVRAAHRLAHRYPDGQLFVDLSGFTPAMTPSTPKQSLAKMLRVLGVPDQDMPAELDERAALFRSRVTGLRLLIVLDNARSPDQIRALLPGASRSLVLATSRLVLSGLTAVNDAKLVSVPRLADAEAATLLHNVVGDRFLADPAATTRLVNLCGGLPLALRISAAHLAGQPRLTVPELVGQLTSGDRLAELEVAGDDEASVRTAFEVSYDALDPQARRVYRLLALGPGQDFTLPVVRAALGVHDRGAADALARLVSAHMVEEHAGGRLRYHDLLREHAISRAVAEEPPAQRTAAVRRMLDWYLHSAAAANQILVPYRRPVPLDPASADIAPLAFTTGDDALAWLDSERDNLFAAAPAAVENGQPDVAWKFAAALFAYFDRRRPWDDWFQANRTGLDAARAARDQFGEAWMLTNLGAAYFDLSRPHDAVKHHEQALAIRDEIGDAAGRRDSLTHLGNVLHDLERYDESVASYHEAVAISRELGDLHYVAIILQNLGDAYRERAMYEDALAQLHAALAVRNETGGGLGESLTVSLIGATLHDLGRYAEAIDWLERALHIARTRDRVPWFAGHILVRLGRTLAAAGDNAAAKVCFSDALSILDALRDPDTEDFRAELAELSGGGD